MTGPADLFHVDAFAAGPLRGNPAAVCLLREQRDAGWMQALAAELNLSETAFVTLGGRPRIAPGSSAVPPAPRRRRLRSSAEPIGLRWFTPKVEVDLCGHATLASAHVLWDTGTIGEDESVRFATRSDILTVRRRADGWIEMDFPARTAHAVEPPEGLIEALGIQPVAVRRTGESDVLVEAFDAETVRGVEPDFGLLARIEARGVAVTALADDGEHDFVSRFFAPAVGIPEDPVTGSAHCALGPYWGARLKKDRLRAFQASERGGVVEIVLRGERILLAGQAVTVVEGRLRI